MNFLFLNYRIATADLRRHTIESMRTIALMFTLGMLSHVISAQDPLKAEFYNGKNFEKYIGARSMDKIDLYWETKSPVAGMNPEKCSIRWTGSIEPPVSGEYRFSAKVDYGLRLWIDEELVIDDWALHNWGRLDGKINLESDRLYNFKVEYFNALFGGEIRLMWETPSDGRNDKNVKGATVIDAKYFHETQERPLAAEVLAKTLTSTTNDIVPSKASRNAHVSTSNKEVEPKENIINPSQETQNDLTINNSKRPEPRSVSKANMTKNIIDLYTPKSVQFERARAHILEESEEGLDRLARFLTINTYLNIEIEGHTDLAGDPTKNLELSEQRAYAVARYLVANGVKASRISASGKGGAEPLIQSKGDLYHPENRRVSFKIIIP